MWPTDLQVRRLVHFAGPRTTRCIILLWLLALVLYGLELGFAFLLQQFIAQSGVLPAPVQGLGGIGVTLPGTTLLIGVVGMARVGVTYAQTRIDGDAMESFNHGLRLDLIDRTLASRSVDTGETLTFFHHRILNASVGLRSIHQLVSQGVFTMGLAATLCVMNWQLSAALLAVASIAIVPMRVVHRHVRSTAAHQARTFTTLMAKLGNVFRNIALIRLYNLQGRERRQFEHHLRAYTRDIGHYLHADGLMNAVGPLFALAGIVTIGFAGASRFALDVALLVPFLYLFVRFAQQLGSCAGAAGRLSHALPDLRFIFDWWTRRRLRESTPTAASDDAIGPIEAAVGWALRDVTFGYPNQAPLFTSFDYQVTAGSLVQICGPSGSGKTSLVALLTGEVSPNSGTVEVIADGGRWPIELASDRLRDHLGYASAESYLFAGSLYDNLTYGLSESPDDDFVRRMSRLAECGFIGDLPGGFEHRIDELGQGLSTGQRQRLSLLRALLRHPRALVLDEALSNVDAETEARVLANLRTLRPHCTILWVSHRPLATQADAVVDLHVRLEALT